MGSCRRRWPQLGPWSPQPPARSWGHEPVHYSWGLTTPLVVFFKFVTSVLNHLSDCRDDDHSNDRNHFGSNLEAGFVAEFVQGMRLTGNVIYTHRPHNNPTTHTMAYDSLICQVCTGLSVDQYGSCPVVRDMAGNHLCIAGVA